MTNRSIFLRAFLIVGSCLFLPALAFAYIDPGTGATFVGSMAPLIMGIIGGAFALFLKIFWNPIKRLCGCGKCESTEEEKPEEEKTEE